jgi:hypothetical protein
MKNTIFPILLLIFSGSFVQAQKTDPTAGMKPGELHDYYLKKHRNNKTAAWIMIGGGVVVGLTGAVVTGAETVTHLIIDPLIGNEPSVSSTGPVLIGIGLVSMLGSIPFLVSADNNKRRADLALKGEPITLGNKPFQQAYYPALSLKISF